MLPLLSKKLPDTRIVWMARSNQWLEVKEPAWYVLSQISKGRSLDYIAERCRKKYGLPISESIRFVQEISSSVEEFEKVAPVLSAIDLKPDTIFQLKHKSYIQHSYHVNGIYFSISYGSKEAEYYIHPPLAHLKIDKPTESTHPFFEILESGNAKILREKNNPAFYRIAEDYTRLKRKLFIEVINIIHSKTDSQWMSYIHASAVSNGKESILLSSHSGSGKSTMAALLQSEGLDLVADDLVPIDASRKNAWLFPAAISVKEGAFGLLSPYYGNLSDRSYNLYPHTHPSLRYLHPKPYSKNDFIPKPVRKIIFLRYNPEVNFNAKRLQVSEALQLFHEQAWVSHNPTHAKKFIDWFVKLECWNLEYSDTPKGMEWIKSLFKRLE
jgi:hypothetical protein